MNDTQDSAQHPESPSLRWLALGALIGLAFAALGLLEKSAGPTPLPDGAVARINHAIIDVQHYERALEALAATLGRAPDATESNQVLQQLVDEELLVQRGIEMNMAGTESTVRGAIVQSLIASVTAEADAANPDDSELERFLAERADDYTYATALSVDAWLTDDESAAQRFIAELRNADDGNAEPDERVRRVPGLPSGPLPLERLRMFVGPAIAAAAITMPAGSSAVYARQGRWYVVRVNEHAESVLADLATVRSQVLVDYRRSLARSMLSDYLEGLRRNAELTLLKP